MLFQRGQPLGRCQGEKPADERDIHTIRHSIRDAVGHIGALQIRSWHNRCMSVAIRSEEEREERLSRPLEAARRDLLVRETGPNLVNALGPEKRPV